MQIDVSQRISAPAESVWDLITDLEGSAQVISGINTVEILSDPGPFAVGTRWRESRTMFGKEATEVMEVSALTPGESYTTVAESHGARYESSLTVLADGPDSCTLTMTFSGEPTSPAGKLMAATVGRLFAGATRKALAHDLSDIAAAAEQPRGGPWNESGGRPVGP